MTSWSLARQSLWTGFRLASAAAGHRRILPVRTCVRGQRAGASRCAPSPIVCAATAAAKSRTSNASPKNREIKPPKKAERDNFYAADTVTFESLQLSAAVAASLQNAGFSKPSTVQVTAVSYVHSYSIVDISLPAYALCVYRSCPFLC